MLGKVFKAYDVRGSYPDPLNDNMAWQIGVGSSQFLIADAEAAGESSPMMKNIVVGRDMRTSSPSLSQNLIEGIQAQGGHVLDVGLVDTPFIYFAVNHFDCAGGVMTTASHNPPQYNGFKISKAKAKPVGEATGLADVRKFAAMADRAKSAGPVGRVEPRDLWAPYAAHVLSFLKIDGAKLKVVVDASNGMAGTALPKIFGKKGANVEGLDIVELNFDNSKGEFKHEPNPLVAANLDELRAAVVSQKADLGVCFDGDADRCVVVDEAGEIIGCDHLTAALAKRELARVPGAPVVYDLRSTRALREQIEAAGGTAIRSRVGHVFMKQAIAEHGAVFGGELSGHFYFANNFNADSGVIAMCCVLSLLAEAKAPLSKLVKPAQKYTQSGEINFEIEEKDEALEQVRQMFAGEGDIDELDGVTVDCFDSAGWWANIRKSNTEPLLRLNLEATDAATLEAALEQISPMLGQRVDH